MYKHVVLLVWGSAENRSPPPAAAVRHARLRRHKRGVIIHQVKKVLDESPSGGCSSAVVYVCSSHTMYFEDFAQVFKRSLETSLPWMQAEKKQIRF